MSSGEKTGINWVQVIGAALAAVSSALLLSTIGVAGTVIGAAVGSVIASVGGALYSRGLAASHQQMAAQAAALRRAAQARARGPEGTSVMSPVLDLGNDPSDGPIDDAEIADGAGDVPPEDESDEQGDALFHTAPGKPLPWKRIALIAGALFLVVMVSITAFELLTGKPVSAYTGGTDANSGTTLNPSGQKSDKPSPTPSDDTGDTGDGSSDEATPTETTTDEATPTDTPTGLPTESTTPTATPTDTPTATSTTTAEPAG